jgi:hypothetical protein
MPKKDARGELASTRLELPPTRHARTKGRNGWFTPRLLEAVVHQHRDGTPLITLRQYSRRAPASAGAPWECTLPLSTYRDFASGIESALDAIAKRRRARPRRDVAREIDRALDEGLTNRRRRAR